KLKENNNKNWEWGETGVLQLAGKLGSGVNSRHLKRKGRSTVWNLHNRSGGVEQEVGERWENVLVGKEGGSGSGAGSGREVGKRVGGKRGYHESQPEYGGGSGGGRCGDDEPGDDEDGGEDEED
nr:hypothetical protein [Tanacetum cinerariifolium]